MNERPAIVKFVKIIKRLFVAFSIIAIPLIMASLVLAFAGYLVFQIVAPIAIVLYFVLYGAYALNISMGTVVGMEVTEQVVHIKTKRKTYTYDAKTGCVDLKITKRKFVATFRTQDSQDKFTFYRRVPFGKYYDEQFTLEEMREIYPALEEE